MTVITVLHDVKENVTWLGSNGRATIGSYVGPSRDNKWFAVHGWAIGITGSGPKVEALEAHLNDFPKDASRPHEILKFMKTAYSDFDIGEVEEGLKRYSGNGLLIHKSGAVWDFDNSFCLTPVEPGVFWARGSGMDIALGAGKALKDFVASPKELTRRVLEITIATDVDSPGELPVQTFDANGVLSDPIEA
ncbi:hypothetical protein PUV54_12250 [Hyphococcus flavus]|uniref:Uncharacterized protein n=1 Tax=Hyphococcus flavus TaxID=1866326 RepID=A0AAE9ZAL7_9PROT|nr:hypothetical protein [Hyphococcus flavus]WDI30724.1 hypothetical protein PUV54_12250 [Hyphococcus flavus]